MDRCLPIQEDKEMEMLIAAEEEEEEKREQKESAVSGEREKECKAYIYVSGTRVINFSGSSSSSSSSSSAPSSTQAAPSKWIDQVYFLVVTCNRDGSVQNMVQRTYKDFVVFYNCILENMRLANAEAEKKSSQSDNSDSKGVAVRPIGIAAPPALPLPTPGKTRRGIRWELEEMLQNLWACGGTSALLSR